VEEHALDGEVRRVGHQRRDARQARVGHGCGAWGVLRESRRQRRRRPGPRRPGPRVSQDAASPL
jgi:hypothetical protein